MPKRPITHQLIIFKKAKTHVLAVLKDALNTIQIPYKPYKALNGCNTRVTERPTGQHLEKNHLNVSQMPRFDSCQWWTHQISKRVIFHLPSRPWKTRIVTTVMIRFLWNFTHVCEIDVKLCVWIFIMIYLIFFEKQPFEQPMRFYLW